MLRKQVRYSQKKKSFYPLIYLVTAAFHPNKIYRKIYILDSCHLIYLFIFCHGKEKVKVKRKAVEKLCEPDIRNEFSISLVRITKSVNDHFCASS